MRSKCRPALLTLAATLALGALTAAPAFASGAPSAETKPASPIAQTTATLNGVVNPNGAETKYWFEYGPTGSYGTKTAEVSAGAGTTNIEASKAITGLSVDTVYYYRLAAKNANGTTHGAEGILTTVSKPGLPEFVPHAGSKGETFPLAVEGSIGNTTTFNAEGYPGAVHCESAKFSGSITSAKTVSLTYSFAECHQEGSSENPCTSFTMSGIGSLLYLNKATKQVGVLLPVGRHTVSCDGGAFEEQYRGTLLSPITPINSETTHPEIRYHAETNSKEEFTGYENEKGEKVATQFEWNATDSFWEKGSMEVKVSEIALTTPRGLTIKA